MTGHQGNHGEDVKELYYYLDSTPTHSYMKYLYKYPQKAYPYEELVRVNQNRDRNTTEYEILDTDAFAEDRYWDVFMEVRTALYFARKRVLTFFAVRQGRTRPRQHLRPHYVVQQRSRTRHPARHPSVLVPQHLVLVAEPPSEALHVSSGRRSHQGRPPDSREGQHVLSALTPSC